MCSYLCCYLGLKTLMKPHRGLTKNNHLPWQTAEMLMYKSLTHPI